MIYNPIKIFSVLNSVVGTATRYGLVRGTDAGGGEIFRTRPHRPWYPNSLLYNGYWVFPGGKAAGSWCRTPTPSIAEVKERGELYLYSPSGPSPPVTDRNLLFFFYLAQQPPMGQGLLIHEVSRSHTTTQHSR